MLVQRKSELKGLKDFVFVAELPAIYAFPLLAILLMMVVGPFGRYTNLLSTWPSHVVECPQIVPKRELKFALESFWEGKTSAADLEAVAKELRASIWKQTADAGVTLIPSNTFSYYDQVLDTTALVGAVPPLYGWTGGDIGLDIYFSMARGNATKPAMEMTKWFDTN